MEKVFYLMWLSDIASAISAIGLIALLGAALGIICLAVVDAFDEKDSRQRLAKYLWWLAIPVAIATIAPGKKTIQILAVASAADAVATTQIGQKGLQAIDALLDGVIAKAKKDEK